MSMSVCLSARIPQNPQVQTSRNFLYTLPVAGARSSSDDNAISYVLYGVVNDVTCGHIIGQAKATLMERILKWLAMRQNRRRSLLSMITLLWSPYGIGQTIIFSCCGLFFFFMAALCNRGAIIFLPCSFYLLSSIYLFFPRLISAAGDGISTILPHMVWP